MAKISAREGASFDAEWDFFKHPWFVISDPSLQRTEVLSVNLTTYEPTMVGSQHNDPACVLDVDDHPFIQHPTCVSYASANLCSIDDFELYLTDGRCRIRSDRADRRMLAKIRERAGESKFMEIGHFDILVQHGLA